MKQTKKFGTLPCQYCGNQIDVRGTKQHELYCEKNPDAAPNVPKSGSPSTTTPGLVVSDDIIEAPLDEMENLTRIIREAWPTQKVHSVIRAFSHGNPSDLTHLDELLTIAGANPSARKLIITNWALHRNVPVPAEMEDMYSRGDDASSRKPTTARGYIEELKKERYEALDEMKLKKEELRLRQEIQTLEGGESLGSGTGGTGKLVEMPLLDPRSGRPVFDGQGNPVMVKVDPQREFNYYKLMEMRGAGGQPQESMVAEVMKAQSAAQQQNFQMMMQMMGQTKGGENEQVRMMREEVREQQRRYDEVLRRQETSQQTLRDELQRRELQQLQQKIDTMMTRPSDLDQFHQQYKKMQEMGLVTSPGKDKEVMLLQQQGDVTKQAVGMMDRELANLNAKTDMFLKPLAEVIPEVVRGNIAKQSHPPNVPPSIPDAQLEQMMAHMETPAPVLSHETASPPQEGFKVIGGGAKNKVRTE